MKKAKKHLTNMAMCGIIFRRAERLVICGCGGTADALVSGSSEEIRVGSNPVTCTNKKSTTLAVVPFLFIRMVGFEEER